MALVDELDKSRTQTDETIRSATEMALRSPFTVHRVSEAQ